MPDSTPDIPDGTLHLHPRDNVIVLLRAARAGETLRIAGRDIALNRPLEMGQKLALRPIASGTDILKYGAPIGFAACDIAIGDHVHLHNVTSRYTVIEDMEADDGDM